MKVIPKTENELQAENLLPPGEYPFTILESNEVASKSEKNRGRMMFALKLCVHGDTDKHVFDYFADWFSEYKLRHCAQTIGLLDSYMEGVFDAGDSALAGRSGYVKIGIEEPKSSQFKPKNIVKDYITKEQADAAPKAPAKAPGEAPSDDDVPF